ncbi:MAG TPA: hypothetical protein VFV96_12635 [Verrucomicrobiae bacterium]|nr:hypothetical protein [Verrucomicrobiae bacterium]
MSPFWAGLFENLRGRGRNAAVFLVALACLLVATFLAARLPADAYRDYVFPVLPWLALLLAAQIIRAAWLARARRRERLVGHALSADELRKARAKLVKRPAGAPKNSVVPPA